MTKTLDPGDELDAGKYRIVRLLGRGGMGSVYEAEHRETHKRVAIKCIHPAHAADPEVAERLVREAQAAARVRHPNVVDIYDVGRDGPVIFLVMEYLEGEPLSQLLARGDLPLHALIALLLPAIRGLAAAHKQGVVHRDLKPDNIFLAREGDTATPVPKILDFGISKLRGPGLNLRVLTRSGVAVGTPNYMSYEQLAGDVEIDGRTDVYACGVILYQAITGRVPYEAETFPELMIRFATERPRTPKEVCGGVPGTLSRVVMWALARDRDERIPSMEALALELEPFASHEGLENERTQRSLSRPQPQIAPASSRVEPPRGWTRRPALLLSFASLLVAAGASWLLDAPRTIRKPAPSAPVVAELPRPVGPAPPEVVRLRAAMRASEPQLTPPLPAAVAPPLVQTVQPNRASRPPVSKPARRDFGIY